MRPARIAFLCTALALTGCDDMIDQPKQKVYSPLVGPVSAPAGTVEFQHAAAAPPTITLALLERGKERYEIYCAPCHSELGDGRGMIVQRGFPQPLSFADPRANLSPQHVYDATTNGYGAMYSFAMRVAPDDRWAIAAYIQALRLSQTASASDLPDAQRKASP